MTLAVVRRALAEGRGARDASPVRALLADDEPRARQYLEKLLGEHSEIELVGVAKNGAEALSLYHKLRPEVVFLDIHMADLSGLEVARQIARGGSPVIVFVTAYDQYAVEAFEVAALDYLLKPIRRDRLAASVQRVVSEVRNEPASVRGEKLREALESPQVAGRTPPLKRLPVRHRREVKLLDLVDVPLIFSRDRLVLARAEAHEYLVDYTLQELEQRLPEGQFVRVHRGALVNLDAVESYGGEDGVLVL
jgi:DNA-binding LytR/AlgR family response regulator